MKKRALTTALAVILTPNAFAATGSDQKAAQLEPITVSADLRDISLDKITASVSVLNNLDLQDRGATQFSDVLLQIPNLNFSGEGSVPRHLQIRGMGERDEYTGAPNASVGVSVDGIDFSGIDMPVSLFDVKQLEVLRGPQSTRYGANAFAGLINIETKDPSRNPEGMLEVTGGQYGLREIGLMHTGAFNDKADSPLYRVSIFKHESNGFIKNAYLHKDNTNDENDLYFRGKLRFFLNPGSQLDFTLLHANINNGYDAWSLKNNRTTLSDQPGVDQQKTNAAAIKYQWDGNSRYKLISTTTLANSSMKYSYDGDWVYPGYYSTPFVYNYANWKDRHTFSQEIRVISKPDSRLFNNSTDWLTGLYFSNLDEKNRTHEDSTYYDVGSDSIYGTSDDVGTTSYTTDKKTSFRARNLAFFGQLDHHLTAKTILSEGLRLERNEQDFSSSQGEHFDPAENLWGGNISLSHDLNKQHNIYAAISRGYKAGGFNAGLPANTDQKYVYFNKESMLDYEVGLKSKLANDTLHTKVTLFYMDRKNPQFDSYTYVGSNYIFYTENFDSATNYGLESSADWQVTDNWKLFGSLGLLRTTVEGHPLVSDFTISGREQAQAPNYQYNIGAQYRNARGYFARVDFTGVDAFYFDTVHNARSHSYMLTNARIGYEAERWEIYLWSRNLFNQKYDTRGFFFTNEPTYTQPPQKYVKLGAPRQIGVTFRLHFD